MPDCWAQNLFEEKNGKNRVFSIVPNGCFHLNFLFLILSLLNTLGKHRKLIQANEASMDEEQTIASQSTANQHQRDVEAGRKRN